MRRRRCCEREIRGGETARRPESLRRSGGTLAGWIGSLATLALVPKCPMCLAAYVALVSGMGISVTTAAYLRMSLLIVSVTTMVWLSVKWVAGISADEIGGLFVVNLAGECVGGMGNGGSGTERSSDDGGFSDFGFAGTGFAGVRAVNVDAIGALRGESDRNGDELLVFDGDSAFGDGQFVESPKCFHGFGREGVELFDFGEIFFVKHILLCRRRGSSSGR